MRKLLVLALVLLCSETITAQQINNVFAYGNEKKNSLMLHLEFDPALFWGILYTRSTDIRLGKLERKLMSQIGWKTYAFTYNDLNLNFSTSVMPWQRRINILINIGAENKYLENTVHQANIYNGVASIMPGYYADGWYIGTEIMYKWMLGARYAHSEYYQRLFPDVKDGWYRYRNTYLNLSVNAGLKLSGRLDLDLRAGYRLPGDFQDYSPYMIPLFSDVAINYRF